MATWGTPISLRGAKGDAGLSFLADHGAPASTLGMDSQVYLDVDAFDLYLRSNGTWSKTGNIRGAMGLNGYSGQIAFGSAAPTSSTTDGKADALYIQLPGGEVWTYDAEGDKTWHDSGYSLAGPAGPQGPAGQSVRGTQTYTGNGAPNSDLSTFVPPAQSGDLYYDIGSMGGPYLYVLKA